MSLIHIKQAARGLSLTQLRKLDEWLHEVILKAEESAQAEHIQARSQIVEVRILEKMTYRLEGIRCGKEKCKCMRGKLHGPYWYSYTRIKDKVKSQYVGKKLPCDAEKELDKRGKT
jgi:Family of unknown function (DUF6788)